MKSRGVIDRRVAGCIRPYEYSSRDSAVKTVRPGRRIGLGEESFLLRRP